MTIVLPKHLLLSTMPSAMPSSWPHLSHQFIFLFLIVCHKEATFAGPLLNMQLGLGLTDQLLSSRLKTPFGIQSFFLLKGTLMLIQFFPLFQSPVLPFLVPTKILLGLMLPIFTSPKVCPSSMSQHSILYHYLRGSIHTINFYICVSKFKSRPSQTSQ